MDVTTEAVRHHWVMKNIPAFRSEDFISSPENYLDKLEFQLAQVYNGEDIHNLSNNWKTLTENLLEDDHFGLAINQEGGAFLFDDAKNITRNDKAQKDQARSIYNYIKNNFESVGDYDIKIRNTLMSVYSKKKGSDAELNLLLIAMLRQKGIRADPVILGTRNMGPNPSAYPVLNKINHVICAAWIAGDTLFLDASSENASFDRLPIECYNGHARIISPTDSCSVYFYTDAIKEREMTTVFISNAPDKKLSGTFEQIPGLYASDEVREKVKKTGIKKYFDFAKISFGSDGEVKNPEIDSLKTQDFPVRIYYEFTTNSGDNSGLFYFNPFVNDMYNQNPFKEEIRKYPVELRYPLDEMYVLNME
ncbi:MAG TPA: transglutaminase-like domain-containing protein, partial [Puia sp.]|nr:transglutaminase-like domain-containing protein [Puia sp.]